MTETLPAPAVDVTVEIRPAYLGSVDGNRLASAVATALRVTGFTAPAELTVVVTDDSEMQELNRMYRDLDESTDVLSFSHQEGKHSFVTAPGTVVYLGDIIISWPTAERQSLEQEHSVEDELALLVVHGALHLIGYDHVDEETQRSMWALQDRALASIRREGSEVL